MRSGAVWLACAAPEQVEEFLAGLSGHALLALPWLFEFWAMPHQIAPDGDWKSWVVMGGRGAGKTRAGAEWVRAQVEGATREVPGRCRRVALIGETFDQVREVMVMGESGILACCPPDRRPVWEAGRRRLVWPNGAVATCYSGHEPEALRGPQFDAAWVDELAKWKKGQECWNMLQFALRLTEGQCWGVPGEAQGEWAGQGGRIAVAANGGWVFLPASAGMRGFILDRGLEAIHDGSRWIAGALTLGRQGAGLIAGMAEDEITVGKGMRIITSVAIPAGVMVIGAVARVVEPLGGTLTGWRLGSGETGAEDRFGKGLGTGRGSWAQGLLGSPVTYYQAGHLIMTAENGAFDGGRVRLAVHWLELRLPKQGA